MTSLNWLKWLVLVLTLFTRDVIGACRSSEVDVTRQIFLNETSIQTKIGDYWDRPVTDFDQPVIVNVYLRIRTVIEVVEKTEYILLKVGLALVWTDEIHIWDQIDHLKCVRYVVLPHDSPRTPIWIPKVTVTNE